MFLFFFFAVNLRHAIWITDFELEQSARYTTGGGKVRELWPPHLLAVFM